MEEKKLTNKETLPKEWMELVSYAMKSGITKQEFVDFLEEKHWEINNQTTKK